MKKILSLMIVLALAFSPICTFAQEGDGESNGTKNYLSTGKLKGTWSIYKTNLQEQYTSKGYITIDKKGIVTGGQLVTSTGDETDIVDGSFVTHKKTKRVTGTLTDSDEVTMTIEGQLSGNKAKQILGVINSEEPLEEGFVTLVKMPKNALKYLEEQDEEEEEEEEEE